MKKLKIGTAELLALEVLRKIDCDDVDCEDCEYHMNTTLCAPATAIQTMTKYITNNK